MSGYDRNTTPNIRSIAESPDGRSFVGCFSHGNWTRSSCASMLTGTYPSHHGAGIDQGKIPEGLPTVADYLRQQGYHTIGVSGNAQVSSATGLDRGFVDFNWLSKSTLLDTLSIRLLIRYLTKLRTHSGGFTLDSTKHNTSFLLTEMAKKKIRQTSDSPFFLYIHYTDSHHPYSPPLPYLDRYTEELRYTPESSHDIAIDMSNNLMKHIAEGCQFSDAEWGALKAMYDASIAYVDSQVGDLFKYIQETDENSVFVITGDHGELFGEEGLLAHKISVSNAVTHVPLVIYGPTKLTDYQGEFIQHIDIVKTVLSEYGISSPTIQGHDLRDKTRNYAVIQRGNRRAQKNIEQLEKLSPDFNQSRFHNGSVMVLRGADFKLIIDNDGESLYRVSRKEQEQSDSHPEILAEMKSHLESLSESLQPFSERSRDLSLNDELERQLKDLGYLGG